MNELIFQHIFRGQIELEIARDDLRKKRSELQRKF
jgi:hypothetical protein